jgi:hypothetical protein
LLQKSCTWTPNTSLVEVLKAVVKHIDEPDILRTAEFGSSLLLFPSFFLNVFDMCLEIGKEYQDDRDEFNRKALQCVLKHGITR